LAGGQLIDDAGQRGFEFRHSATQHQDIDVLAPRTGTNVLEGIDQFWRLAVAHDQTRFL